MKLFSILTRVHVSLRSGVLKVRFYFFCYITELDYPLIKNIYILITYHVPQPMLASGC